MNRIQITLGLIALLLGLVLLQDAEPPANAPQTLSTLEIAEISSISLYSGATDTPAIQLEQRDDLWHLLHPVAMPADPMSVHEILRLASARSHVQRASDSLDLASLKLQPPLWRVQLDALELQVGGTESISRRRYVRLGDTVHLIGDFNPAILDGNYADLADRRLLQEDQTILSLKTSQDRSAIAAEQAAALSQRWQQAKADWLIRPLDIHFDAVTDRVTITTSAGSIDFLIAERAPQLQLIRPDLDLLYVLPASAAAELLPAS